jgi:PPK2 family polyphosphate:nucleotide phosphotransferase
MKHSFDPKHFTVKPGTKVKLKNFDPAFTGGISDKQRAKLELQQDIATLAAAQDILWANAKYSVLIILQAMDAAGKDGLIKHVMTGMNPQGCVVHSFKAPSDEELKHHYLWRPMRYLPRKGEVAIFNRSYYEEVLVVRVHPELLERQNLVSDKRGMDLWKQRYEEINAFEHTLVRNGTLIAKFVLNVSKEEQRNRFMERLDNPEKNWKFSAADVRERQHWNKYQHAFEDMLTHTSTKWAPWHVIPADNKWYTRAAVADLIAGMIDKERQHYPKITAEQKKALEEARKQLVSED